jgi:SAM-dependent methyltransferase
MANPNFETLIKSIYTKSPLQKKKLNKHLSKRDKTYFQEAEQFCIDYFGYLESQGISVEDAIDSYLKLCQDMMVCQASFMRTGEYPVIESDHSYENIYTNEEKMKSYMIGLAVSQYLWETHYDMFIFFTLYIKNHSVDINSYLEIGPGHSLFLNKALSYLSRKAKITTVDISLISINIAESIVKYFWPGESRVQYYNSDMLDFDVKTDFDFITMGEVLEHVNYPEQLLMKLRKLLKNNGRAFVSTCVDAPAIDHVYHFKSIQEIRDLFSICNLSIEDELVLPVEDLPMDEIIARKISINYCAILKTKSKTN